MKIFYLPKTPPSSEKALYKLLKNQTLGYLFFSFQKSSSNFPNSRMVKCQCHYYWSLATISRVSNLMGDSLIKTTILFFSRWVNWCGRSLPGAGEYISAKHAPQVYMTIMWRMCQMVQSRGKSLSNSCICKTLPKIIQFHRTLAGINVQEIIYKHQQNQKKEYFKM